MPLIGAIMFMIAPYHLFNFYLRGAIAEFLATAIFPFVLWGIRQMLHNRRYGFASTAIAYAALIMSHLPLALLASLFLFVPYAVVSASGRRPDLLRIAAALGTGVLIAAVYLIPAIALEPYRSSADLWALPYLQPAGWSVWNTASWNVATFSAVTIVAAGLAIALVALLLRHRSSWGFWALACTGLAVGVLPFIWSVPLLRSVQFPFRLLPVAELAFVTAFRLPRRGAHRGSSLGRCCS